MDLVLLGDGATSGWSSVDLSVFIVILFQRVVDVLFVWFHIWVYHVYVLSEFVYILLLLWGHLIFLPRSFLLILNFTLILMVHRGDFIHSLWSFSHVALVKGLIGVVVAESSVGRGSHRLNVGFILFLLGQERDFFTAMVRHTFSAVIILIQANIWFRDIHRNLIDLLYLPTLYFVSINWSLVKLHPSLALDAHLIVLRLILIVHKRILLAHRCLLFSSAYFHILSNFNWYQMVWITICVRLRRICAVNEGGVVSCTLDYCLLSGPLEFTD